MTLTITTDAFSHEAPIPRRYTCEGADLSPPLSWAGVPDGTRSLVLIVDDPDAPDPAAPRRTWVHWVLFDLPKESSGLAEGATTLPSGARDGLNDWTTRLRRPVPSDRAAPLLLQALRARRAARSARSPQQGSDPRSDGGPRARGGRAHGHLPEGRSVGGARPTGGGGFVGPRYTRSSSSARCLGGPARDRLGHLS